MALWLKTASGLVPVGGEGSYLTVTPWAPLTLSGNWVNYGSGFQNAEYRLFGDKVELRGLIKLSTGSIVIGSQTNIATLPVGFRPASIVIDNAVMVEGASAEDLVQIRVSTAGVISYLNLLGSTLSTAGYVHLDGVSFSTTAVNAVPKYSEVPNQGSGARATYTASQNITTSVTIPTFSATVSDPVGEYTFNNALGRIFVTNAGLYRMEYNIAWQVGTQSASAYYQYFLRHNPGAGGLSIECLRTAAGTYDSDGKGMVLRMAAGDFVDSTIVQTAGGTGILRAGSYISIHKIRD